MAEHFRIKDEEEVTGAPPETFDFFAVSCPASCFRVGVADCCEALCPILGSSVFRSKAHSVLSGCYRCHPSVYLSISLFLYPFIYF